MIWLKNEDGRDMVWVKKERGDMVWVKKGGREGYPVLVSGLLLFSHKPVCFSFLICLH